MGAALRKVVIACDKFKGSLTVDQVIHHVTEGVKAALPDAEVDGVVVADGGDGTLAAALAAGFTRHDVTVNGPTGRPNPTAFAVRDDVAVVEMADACGLVRLPSGKRDPMGASSYGLGQLIAAALDSGVSKIILGVGGSASTDGGVGMMTALGGKFLDADGQQIALGGRGLAELDQIDLTALHPRIHEVQFTLASDVENPLIGPKGAAAIFAPQKGATKKQVGILDDGLRHLAGMVSVGTWTSLATKPGAGAAGGVGFAAMAMLGATMSPGIELVLDLVDFDKRVQGADLVITGEGAMDEQSLAGKTPFGVHKAAARHDVPVIAVCGVVKLTPEQVQEGGIQAAHALTDIESNVDECIKNAGPLLEKLTANAVREFAG